MNLSQTRLFLITAILIFQFTHVAASVPVDPAPSYMTIEITPLTMDDPELVNPGRGYYRWRGEEIVPQPEPAHDEYDRYFWYDPKNPELSLETAPGVYNFTPIDKAIADAARRGHKFAFRIRAMANIRSGNRYVPDYLSECGWRYRGTFIPDWNSACFLDNAEKLMKALGERYNDDPRIAWMDIGLFGEWGEWTKSREIYSSAPEGFKEITEENLNRIIDMQVDAFPDVRKVMMVKTYWSAVNYALSRSDQIGWRVDCFARSGYFDFKSNLDYQPAWDAMRDRWKTAPVIVEFCAGNISLSTATPIQQVQDFHISLISNGNFRSWNRLSDAAHANLPLVGKTAGYRYQLRDISVPAVWTPGVNIYISTAWENTGVAPHYEKTEVVYRLYDPVRSKVVWEAASSLDLQKLLPTDGYAYRVQDNLPFSAQVDPGVYELRVRVVDPTGYRQPLKLAIAGRQSDGSYLLGNVNVGGYTKGR